MSAVPYGRCHCGCGGKTNTAKQSRTDRGWVLGEPKPYIANHHRRSSPVEYREEDRGFHTPCWIWQRHCYSNGYGEASVGEGRTTVAHRVVFERHCGPIAAGAQLDHLCGVPACVNPDHLEPVTNAENVRRSAKAKLTYADAEMIRCLRGALSDEQLAERFGVSLGHISKVATGAQWSVA